MNKYLSILGGVILLLFPLISAAQVSGSLLKLSANSLLPVNSSWSLTLTNLAGNGAGCASVSNTGLIGWTSCSSGGGSTFATTSISATYPILWNTSTAVISTALSSSTLTAASPLTGSFAQVGTGGTLGIQQASGSQGGYLSSTDWTTFNNKQYAFSTSTLSASSPLTGSFIQVGSGGSLGCQTASGSQAGCLSSTDWTTFNSKQANLSLLAGTYSNGDVCTYATSGTLLNCNTALPTGTVTSVTASAPLFSSGGTTPNITWAGLATTSQPSSSNLLVSNGGAGVYGVATSTLTPTSPLGGSFVQVGSGGSITCSTCNTSNATVSSVGLSSTNSTLTIGSTPVTTSGTITADLNLAHANTWTALQSFGNATSTLFTCTTCWATTASTTNEYVSSLGTPAGTFIAADPSGKLIATTSPSGVGGAYPFAGTGNSTSTLTQFNGGLTAYASSTIGNGTQAGGLTISGGATSTGNVLINTGATGTTTLQVGQATNPACVVSEDTGGAGVSYTWWDAGIMYVSTTACD